MNNLVQLLMLTLILTSCGTDEKTTKPAAKKKDIAKQAKNNDDQDKVPVKNEVTYEKPAVADNPTAELIEAPIALPGPAAEDPIVAQKIQEMDTLIQERVNLLMTWNVWDDYRDKPLVNESPSRQTPAHYFQLHDSHPWMKVGGLFGQEVTFLDYYYAWWFGKKVYHCGELVDSTDSDLFVEYTGRDTSEKSKLSIQVYFYTPHENGPIYITKIKLAWKFSNGVEQESIKEANCQ